MGVRDRLARRAESQLAPGEVVHAAFFASTPMLQRLVMVVVVPIVVFANFARLPTMLVGVALAALALVAAGDRLARIIVRTDRRCVVLAARSLPTRIVADLGDGARLELLRSGLNLKVRAGQESLIVSRRFAADLERVNAMAGSAVRGADGTWRPPPGLA